MSETQKLMSDLRRFVRSEGARYLKDPNITSIGIGHKNGDGALSIVFTVREKVEASALESLGSQLIPERIDTNGLSVPTDVIQRGYSPSYRIVEHEQASVLKTRLDPLVPGASVSHPDGTAGTLGAIVFDDETGAACILSNWHVLHGETGQIGDKVVQPGPFDDNNIAANTCGTLLRSHLGIAGDCALARIEDRDFERAIHGLDTAPAQMAEVELGDTVVKTGRTTATTYGVVRRTDVIVQIDFGETAGSQNIGCFEIGPNPDRPAVDGEISMGGDSGSVWIISDGESATDVFAGLHFAGESGNSADEHALACYPRSIQSKLRFKLTPPNATTAQGSATTQETRRGYDAEFLGRPAPMPELSLALKRDAVNFGRAQTIPYTHFSVCLSAERRLARFVAWNTDAARKVQLGRHDFRLDDRIAEKHQLDDTLYADNKLDRGHIARRADLAWGAVDEARRANRESFFFTNIAPQHESYNQSKRGGIWGRLEDLILEEAGAKGIRISCIAGPIFADDDPSYRNTLIPRSFWKLIAYRGADDALRAACFVLSQRDLLHDIEGIDLDPFQLFQVSVPDLATRTGMGFDAYGPADVTQNSKLLSDTSAERLASMNIKSRPREITHHREIAF
ncbi:DNA/RNA non-specific endonuclease [Roseobacter sinensis]|uniref:DNA/RNA non-specific endonuclease n=1 Tax=Roseobacter sinensis TaxID=2931391 RepID=A0ABT3BJR3_9RHOB|nr:DNA/RNA non-specific endonuclease [Roseobacter sp. WL0113]MCV3273344.1 DNA/RNA non-specific endonuclease [Roseobacter sp. WL0113]